MQLHNLHELGDEFERLIQNNQIDQVFSLARKHAFLKGYQTFQDEFMLNAHKGVDYETFKQRLLTFLRKNIDAEADRVQTAQERTLNDKQTEIAQAEVKLNRLHQEINQAKAELNGLHQEISQAKAELNELRQEINQVQNASPTPVTNAIITEEERAAIEWLEAAQNLPHDEDKILAYDKAINLKPDYAEAYFGRGLAKFKLKKHKEAILDFTTAIEYKGNDNKAYYYRGCSRYYLEQYTKAIHDFSEAILIAPKNASYYFWRAKCHNYIFAKPSIIQDLQYAIQLDSNKKQEAKEDIAFKQIRRDTHFKKLVE